MGIEPCLRDQSLLAMLPALAREVEHLTWFAEGLSLSDLAKHSQSLCDMLCLFVGGRGVVW